MNAERLFLIGPMGAGKTSVGKALSAYLGFPVVDVDFMITKIFRLSVKQIFANLGEDRFRREESKIIEKVTCMSKVVVATGGGCIEEPRTREILQRCGKVIYLKVSEEIQKKRLQNSTDRPLLTKIDQLQYREPLYSAIADIVVDTDYLTVSEIVDDVYNFCRKCA